MSTITNLVNQFPYSGLFILLILGAFGLPIPEDTTLILCGFLIATDVVMVLPGLIIVYAGLLSSDFILYCFGKKYGPSIVKHRIFRKIISPDTLSLIQSKFDRWGVFCIVIGRHIIGIRAQLLISAGVMKMPVAKFIITDALTIPISMLIMIGAGYVGGNSLKIFKKDITRIEHLGVLLIIVLFVAYLLIKFFRSRKESMN
jgi:membrane protein DedA with SNARE-associated domain